jgi:hypothetical protein
MVAVDGFVPQRAGFAFHHVQTQTVQFMDRRLQQNAGLALRCAMNERSARIDPMLRCRQLDQPFAVHPQQRHPAAHVLQAAVALAPIEGLADPIRQLLAARFGVGADNIPNSFDLLRTEHPAAVAFVR